MTPEDIAETVYIRLSETDDRGEHIRIIAGAVREAYKHASDELEAERERLVIRKQTAISDTSRIMYDYAETVVSVFRNRFRALGTEGE